MLIEDFNSFVLTFRVYKGGFWLRVFKKYGFTIINRKINKPLFSVRNGYLKEYVFGKYGFRFLK